MNPLFRIRVTQAVRLDGVRHLAGATIEVDTQTAVGLIRERQAVLVNADDFTQLMRAYSAYQPAAVPFGPTHLR